MFPFVEMANRRAEVLNIMKGHLSILQQVFGKLFALAKLPNMVMSHDTTAT